MEVAHWGCSSSASARKLLTQLPGYESYPIRYKLGNESLLPSAGNAGSKNHVVPALVDGWHSFSNHPSWTGLEFKSHMEPNEIEPESHHKDDLKRSLEMQFLTFKPLFYRKK